MFQIEQQNEPLPVQRMMRCIEVAYKLIERGEKPTINGIKRAYDYPVDSSSENITKFYSLENNDHYAFGDPKSNETTAESTPGPFVSFSPVRCGNRLRNFEQSITELHKFDAELDDVDYEIFCDNFDNLTKNEKRIVASHLKDIRDSNPIRYKRLNELFSNKSLN